MTERLWCGRTIARGALAVRVLMVLLVLLVLGGCAATSPQGTGSTALADAQSWFAAGKISVRDGTRGESATFRWQQHDRRWVLELRGPLGAGAVRVEGDRDGAVLDDGRTPPRRYADLDALGAAVLGVPVPLESLSRWLRGAGVPAGHAADASDRFVEDGWRVVVRRRAIWFGESVPVGIDVERASVRVRIVVRQWEWPLADASAGLFAGQ